MPVSNADPGVSNLVDEWTDFNLLAVDEALQQVLARDGVAAFAGALNHYGQLLGQAQSWRLAERCNRHAPELQQFDARGRRIDRVEYHPDWHALMRMQREQGLIALPFASTQPGRWLAWAAGFYLHGQVEQGTLCPATMTTAAIPVLRKEPALWRQLREPLYANVYDERDLPLEGKRSIWVGMGMTEMQGGSDVRANTSTATPVAGGGRGGEYRLDGHKWFFSAPMSDAHLVVARAAPDGGHACFWVPRWRPDGGRNGVRILRLKDKVGNRSNASGEIEFDAAYAVMLGEEGRGIPTILEMASHTRLNCVLGSAAMLRSATVQAIHYARRRQAFGRPLAAHPLMRTVLADLALESEAALQLAMHLAACYELDTQGHALARAYKRIMTPAAKFWVCKRAVEVTGEAMEALGGNGYVRDSVMARLFCEAPVNSIWEGSGNIMCLDVLRALARDGAAAQLLLRDLAEMAAGDAPLAALAQSLARRLARPADALQGQARRLVQDLVLLAQAGLMRQQAPQAVADAFIATRLGGAAGAMVMGAWTPDTVDTEAILRRALPEI